MPETTNPQPAVWADGDPLMEAIAAAIWEQCRTEYPSSVVDDPRNVAAVAAAVVRRLADEAQQPETQASDDATRLAKVVRWVTSEVVTARTEFGNGYRAAQRDIRDLIKGRFDNDAAPAAVSQPGKEA